MMDKYDFAECFGMVLDYFVEESMEGSPQMRDRFLTRRAMIAAGICLFAITALFMLFVGRGTAPVGPPLGTVAGPNDVTTPIESVTDTAETTASPDVGNVHDTSSWQAVWSQPASGPWRSVLSWAKVIAVIAAIAGGGVMLAKSVKYFRALWKRFCLLTRLKRICRRRKYGWKRLSSCYKSIFKVTDSPELLITIRDKKYAVKFFTCLRYRDTYTLENIDHYTTHSNTKMILLDSHYPSAGFKVDSLMWMPRTARLESGIVKEVEVLEDGGAATEEYPDAEKILCVNPISVEMRRVVKNRTEQVFDGDKIDGYTVYSGKALCKLLD